MASLASMIMEGTSIYGKPTLNRHYDHETGPMLIAIESAEALRDIFEATFYQENACDIKAACEGYTDIDSSPYAATLEGVFADAFTKIKDFFIKLKEKVIEFFHSMVRFLSGYFMSGKKWISKYEKELKALGGKLKGYEVDMYKYVDSIKSTGSTVASAYADLASSVESDQKISQLVLGKSDFVNSDGTNDSAPSRNEDKLDEAVVEFGKTKLLIKTYSSSDDDFGKECWSFFRTGADGESDREKTEVTSSFISTGITCLKNSDKDISEIDRAANAAKKAYDSAIKKVDKFAKKGEDDASKDKTKDANGQEIDWTGDIRKSKRKEAELARATSAYFSRCQTLINTLMNEWKNAVKERNAAYQKAFVGAFGYARKHAND